jgi:hypothetical protein
MLRGRAISVFVPSSALWGSWARARSKGSENRGANAWPAFALKEVAGLAFTQTHELMIFFAATSAMA